MWTIVEGLITCLAKGDPSQLGSCMLTGIGGQQICYYAYR